MAACFRCLASYHAADNFIFSSNLFTRYCDDFERRQADTKGRFLRLRKLARHYRYYAAGLMAMMARHAAAEIFTHYAR